MANDLHNEIPPAAAAVPDSTSNLPDAAAAIPTGPAALLEAGPTGEAVAPVDTHAVPEATTVAGRIVNGAAFALSAILSPYLVLPLGTVAIIGSIEAIRTQFYLYTAISVLFSTVLPALFVVVQVLRKKITDVHIMDRAQRSGPFWIAIGSSALGALVLRHIGADMKIWSISMVLALNGMVLTWITSFWKISMHVAVLSATVTAALMTIPQVSPWPLLAMIPALMWARVTRGRHTIWQGVAGATLSAALTALFFFALRWLYLRFGG
jgi:hypothetical protein